MSSRVVSGPCLLDTDFISKFKLQIAPIDKFTDYEYKEQMTAVNPTLFSNELGCYKSPIKIKI